MFTRSGSQGYMLVVLRGPIDREIVKIDIAASVDNEVDKYLTVERGQGGTGSQAWPAGTLIFLSTTADHYGDLLQPDATRQIDFNPNGALAPNYAGEKVFQYAGCKIRWFMSFNAVDPYWALIAGEPCPNEVWLQPPGFDWPVWGQPGLLTSIDNHDAGTGDYYSVFKQGGFIFVACTSGGLRSYTVDAEGELTLVDTDFQAGSSYVGVWGDGTFIYCACAGSGIRSYSVNGAGILTFLDSHWDGGSYRQIWGDGNFVYAACQNAGVISYGVDGSGNLTKLDRYDAGAFINTGWYQGVIGVGTFLYVACHLDGLRVLTVDGSGMFSFVNRISIGLYRINRLWFDGTLLYSVGSGAFNPTRYGGVRTYSLATPGTPLLIATWQDAGATTTWLEVHGDGSYIYATTYSDGLYCFSLPDQFGNLTLLDTDKQGGSPEYRGLWSDNNFVYVADSQTFRGLRSYTVAFK
jgi:6-phosphogluconolactonase (cycloisomerase 2 family)